MIPTKQGSTKNIRSTRTVEITSEAMQNTNDSSINATVTSTSTVGQSKDSTKVESFTPPTITRPSLATVQITRPSISSFFTRPKITRPMIQDLPRITRPILARSTKDTSTVPAMTDVKTESPVLEMSRMPVEVSTTFGVSNVEMLPDYEVSDPENSDMNDEVVFLSGKESVLFSSTIPATAAESDISKEGSTVSKPQENFDFQSPLFDMINLLMGTVVGNTTLKTPTISSNFPTFNQTITMAGSTTTPTEPVPTTHDNEPRVVTEFILSNNSTKSKDGQKKDEEFLVLGSIATSITGKTITNHDYNLTTLEQSTIGIPSFEPSELSTILYQEFDPVNEMIRTTSYEFELDHTSMTKPMISLANTSLEERSEMMDSMATISNRNRTSGEMAPTEKTVVLTTNPKTNTVLPETTSNDFISASSTKIDIIIPQNTFSSLPSTATTATLLPAEPTSLEYTTRSNQSKVPFLGTLLPSSPKTDVSLFKSTVLETPAISSTTTTSSTDKNIAMNESTSIPDSVSPRPISTTPKEIVKGVTEAVATILLDDNRPTTSNEVKISTLTTFRGIDTRAENLDDEYSLDNSGDDLFVTTKDITLPQMISNADLTTQRSNNAEGMDTISESMASEVPENSVAKNVSILSNLSITEIDLSSVAVFTTTPMNMETFGPSSISISPESTTERLVTFEFENSDFLSGLFESLNNATIGGNTNASKTGVISSTLDEELVFTTPNNSSPSSNQLPYNNSLFLNSLFSKLAPATLGIDNNDYIILSDTAQTGNETFLVLSESSFDIDNRLNIGNE